MSEIDTEDKVSYMQEIRNILVYYEKAGESIAPELYALIEKAYMQGFNEGYDKGQEDCDDDWI